MEQQRTRKLRRPNRQKSSRASTGHGGRFEELVKRAPHLRSLLRAETPESGETDNDEDAFLDDFRKDLAGE